VKLLRQWAEDPAPVDEDASAEFECLLRERRLSFRPNDQTHHRGENTVC